MLSNLPDRQKHHWKLLSEELLLLIITLSTMPACQNLACVCCATHALLRSLRENSVGSGKYGVTLTKKGELVAETVRKVNGNPYAVAITSSDIDTQQVFDDTKATPDAFPPSAEVVLCLKDGRLVYVDTRPGGLSKMSKAVFIIANRTHDPLCCDLLPGFVNEFHYMAEMPNEEGIIFWSKSGAVSNIFYVSSKTGYATWNGACKWLANLLMLPDGRVGFIHLSESSLYIDIYEKFLFYRPHAFLNQRGDARCARINLDEYYRYGPAMHYGAKPSVQHIWPNVLAIPCKDGSGMSQMILLKLPMEQRQEEEVVACVCKVIHLKHSLCAMQMFSQQKMLCVLKAAGKRWIAIVNLDSDRSDMLYCKLDAGNESDGDVVCFTRDHENGVLMWCKYKRPDGTTFYVIRRVA